MNGHVLEQLSAYLDGELGREEHAAVQGHLSVCAGCAQRLEELAALDDVARALPAEAPPGYFEALPARVRARLEAQRRAPRLPVWSWAAAAVLLLAVLTPAVLRRDAAPAAPPAPQQQPPPATRAEEPKAGLLERKDESPKRSQEPGGYAAAPAPAATVPPPAVARPAPAPELRKQVREEALEGYSAAPQSTNRVSATPPPVAAEALELDGSRRDDDAAAQNTAPRDALRSQRQAAAKSEGERMRAGAASVLSDEHSAADARYGSLLAATAPEDAAAARAQRDAWRAFARDHASHTGADEARVRALEAGAAAYRLGGDPRDLERARAEAEAYLARPDAAQPDRVRALLRGLD